jgi:hypothetical protein
MRSPIKRWIARWANEEDDTRSAFTRQEESTLWPEQVMSKEAVHDIIRNVVEQLLLEPKGFIPVAPLKWVRDVDAPIRQVFWYAPRRDESLAPCWGISMDFVPHITDQHVIAWHASTAQAQADIMAHLPSSHFDLFHTHGPRPIKRDFMQVIVPALQEADRFWGVCAQPAGPHRALQWAMAYMKPMGQEWLYLQNPLAILFVGAKCTGLDGALALLDQWFKSEPHPPQTKERIRELLVEAAKDPFPLAPKPCGMARVGHALTALLRPGRLA